MNGPFHKGLVGPTAVGCVMALPLPPWAAPADLKENWRASAWHRPSRALF